MLVVVVGAPPAPPNPKPPLGFAAPNPPMVLPKPEATDAGCAPNILPLLLAAGAPNPVAPGCPVDEEAPKPPPKPDDAPVGAPGVAPNPVGAAPCVPCAPNPIAAGAEPPNPPGDAPNPVAGAPKPVEDAPKPVEAGAPKPAPAVDGAAPKPAPPLEDPNENEEELCPPKEKLLMICQIHLRRSTPTAKYQKLRFWKYGTGTSRTWHGQSEDPIWVLFEEANS